MTWHFFDLADENGKFNFNFCDFSKILRNHKKCFISFSFFEHFDLLNYISRLLKAQHNSFRKLNTFFLIQNKVFFLRIRLELIML